MSTDDLRVKVAREIHDGLMDLYEFPEQAGGRGVKEWRFEIWQDGMMVAATVGTSRERAFREALHYLSVYVQDGPAEMKFPRGCSDLLKRMRQEMHSLSVDYVEGLK